MLNQFEQVREPSSHDQLVSSVLIETANLNYEESLVILKYCDSLHHSINLGAFGKEVHSALLIEDCFLAIRAQVNELVFIDKQFWRPGWRHVKDVFVFGSLFFFLLFFLLVICSIIISISFLFIMRLNHDVFPFSSLVISKVEVNLIQPSRGIKVDPKVFVIENALNAVVRSILDVVPSPRCWFDEESFRKLPITLLHQYPAVKPALAIWVVFFVVRLIIINCYCLDLCISFRLHLLAFHFFIVF